MIATVRSHHVDRDYAALVPRVLDCLYEDPDRRARVKALLEDYQGNEIARVRLGILKASRGDLDQIERLVHLAKSDWRDLLVTAEYPLSFGKLGLQESDPERYDGLLEREQKDYDRWLTEVLVD